MAAYAYIDKIAREIGEENGPGLTIENLAKSADMRKRLFDRDAHQLLIVSDMEKMKSKVQEECHSGQSVPAAGEIRQITKSVICSVDPRWLPVLIPVVVDNIYDDNGSLPISISYIAEGEQLRIISKIVYDYHELFVGFKLNKIYDRIPAFVYTFGHKPCHSTDTERVGIVCFPSSEKYATGKVQLLTEYVSDSISLDKWLSEPRTEEDIKMVLFQVLSNLLEANTRVGFVHGDLHNRNILVAPAGPNDRVIVPLDGKLIQYKSSIRARIIDYGLSTVVDGEDTFIGYTFMPTNHESVWSDIIKLFLNCNYSRVPRNRELLDKIASEYFGILIPIREYVKIMESSMLVMPPNSRLYEGMADLKEVCRGLSLSFQTVPGTPGTYKLVPLSAQSRLALGAMSPDERDQILGELIGSYLGTLETFLDVAETKHTGGHVNPIYFSTLSAIFALAEFLGKERGHFEEFRNRALYMRKYYEDAFTRWT